MIVFSRAVLLVCQKFRSSSEKESAGDVIWAWNASFFSENIQLVISKKNNCE